MLVQKYNLTKHDIKHELVMPVLCCWMNVWAVSH